MLNLNGRKTKTFLITCLLIGFFLTSIPKANAGGWPVFDGPLNAQKAVSNVMDAASLKATESLSIKEILLDGIAWAAANAALEHIADATVDWINSGFDGSPAFMTNIGDFMQDVGDQTLGEFIQGSPLAFLCSPFGLDIKIALTLEFGGEREAYCTLSEVFENVDNAVNDLGSNWTWSKWNNIIQRQNNVYGAFLDARMEATLKLAEEKNKEIMKSNWGNGFLQFEHCVDGEKETKCREVKDMTGDSQTVCEKVKGPKVCEAKTPGKIIESELGDVLKVGKDKLVVADEIDEIIGALLNQLISSVFNSAEGLFGSNPSDNGFSTVPTETTGKMKEHTENDLQKEKDYKSWKNQSLNSVISAESYLQALINCWDSYTGTGENPLSLSEVKAKKQAAQSIINNQITPLKTRLQTEIESADTNIKDLELILEELETTDNDATAVYTIWNKFSKLDLHTETDAILAEQEFHGPTTDGSTPIQTQMNTIIANVMSEKDTCKEGGGDFVLSSTASPTCNLTANPGGISLGESSTIIWSSTNATHGFIDNGVGELKPIGSGSVTVTPSQTTKYTGLFYNNEGVTPCYVTITIN